MGSACSYELRGDRIIGRFMGLLPVRQIQLSNVDYLRLATRDEIPPLYMLLNWSHFLTHRRTFCPVYVLQTNKKHNRILLKLKGDMHFKLRQVLGRQNLRPQRAAAA